ncbi:MAG: hypothetical protein A2Y82_01255 [Candidatus Buchananbacteria bacterium RBG_13_36_9]|uniref:Uncharacterized protein n=1 Tax=Candidatus Buchananbacteria bacterium RBG_13_36_9 TaxID=1797530 RepID=A0A1G1XQF5_9BACT|nr:MAG: hypothetical protein A2Y82_01255 [Candidatus Buchananbacteria bacterium RBG_13_36_9]
MAIVLIISALFLLKQKYQEYKYEKQYCEVMINGPDPYSRSPKGFAMSLYYECINSPRESGNCYAKYHQEMIDCLEFRKETMTEEEIKMHLTGGLMEKRCQDSANYCNDYHGAFPDYPGIEEAMTQYCIWKIEKACADLKGK